MSRTYEERGLGQVAARVALGASCLACLLLVLGCSTEEPPEEIECVAASDGDFDVQSGWQTGDYCAAPSELGCFPFFGSTVDECGPFISMRTSVTTADQADACATLVHTLNCNTFSDDAGNELGFWIDEADRFTMRAKGSLDGKPVDTFLFFNPCHMSCLSAITLEELNADQQKICEIPRQGKPECLFPPTAHTITFARADVDGVVIRLGGRELVLGRSQ